MEKMKHSPSPWTVKFFGNEDDGENMFFVHSPSYGKLHYGIEIMMEDYGEQNDYPREQRLADAHLISAAPELYKALSDYINYGDSKIARDNAIKALSKARGVVLANEH